MAAIRTEIERYRAMAKAALSGGNLLEAAHCFDQAAAQFPIRRSAKQEREFDYFMAAAQNCREQAAAR